MAASLHDLLPLGLDWAGYASMGGMVFAGACLQGVGGLGFAMFCAPLAALLFPELVPGPLIAMGGTLALLSGVREFGSIDWRSAGAALAGRAAGTALAGACLALLSAATLSLLFAGLILGAVALSLGGWRVAPSTRNTAVAGVASGLMGTITSAGAPPFAIAMQHVQPARLRATLGCVFFAGSVLSLAMLAAVGRLAPAHLWLSLLLMPWVMGGFAASGALKHRFSGHSLRGLLLGLAAFGALGILVQAWLGH